MDYPELPLPQYRHAHFVVEDWTPLDILYDAEGFPVIPFDPVPMQRRRRNGWDEDRQRAFIALLARVPSVSHAAKVVGLSARSAYKLLLKPGAEGFGKAWDLALEHGMARLRVNTLSRCLQGGDFVPVYRKGKMVRIEHRRNDALAMALVSGKRMGIEYYRRGAQRRWRQEREWNSLDAEQAADIEAAALAKEEYARELEDLLRREAEREAAARLNAPRVRRL